MRYVINHKLKIAPEFVLEDGIALCYYCKFVINPHTDLCNRCYNK